MSEENVCPICNYSFDNETLLENHKLIEHPNKFCTVCKKHLDYLPTTCNYCDDTYCEDHRLPENHECSGLNRNTDSGAEEKEKGEEASNEQKKEENIVDGVMKSIKIVKPVSKIANNVWHRVRNINWHKGLPILGIIGLVFISSFRETNAIFKEGQLRVDVIFDGVKPGFQELQTALVATEPVELALTFVLIFTIWTGFRYWLQDLKYIHRNNNLLERLVITLIFVIVVMRHIDTGTAIGFYIDWAVFLSVLYLELSGTWFIAKTIDTIDLRSDLYLWLLRLSGTAIMFLGVSIIVSSGMALSLQDSSMLLENATWIAGICIFFLGAFMDYRSLRREPAIHVY